MVLDKERSKETGETVFSSKRKTINYTLSFQDSLLHLKQSLANLIESMIKNSKFKSKSETPKEPEFIFDHLRFLPEEFPDREQLDLLVRKGVYPYSYVNEKTLKET